jgi:VWFA-related protein
MARLHVVGALALLAAQALHAQDQQPPRFQSGVEVVTVDVTVVDGEGRPVLGLRPEDFTVRVDDEVRRVLTAQFISVAPAAARSRTDRDTRSATPLPAPYSANDTAGGRLILLAIDQPNIRRGGVIPYRKDINRFLDGLQASDRVGVIALGVGAVSVPLTTDRQRVRQAVEKAVGGIPYPPLAADKTSGEQTVEILKNVLLELADVDAPKTLILMSEGLVFNEYRHLLGELERAAARSRTIIYGLRLDARVNDISRKTQDTALGPDLTEPVAATPRGGGRSQGASGVVPDAGAAGVSLEAGPAEGLYSAAAVTGGSVFTAVMTADHVFDRVRTEISGYYLLGVEADPSHKDGKPHSITVDVGRGGVTVRSRRQLIANRPPASRTPEEALLPAFSSPTPIAALPMRVASFAMRGPGGKDVQLMIHAEVGADYTEQKTVVLGFVIAGAGDKVVQRRAGNSTLRPSIPGEASALQMTTSVNLPPGDYTMKLAVADGDRVGSVEHPVHARLGRVGTVVISDLVIGGLTTAKPVMPPPIDVTVTTDYLQGIIEAYGSGASGITGRLEVAASLDGPALATAPIAAVPAGSDRAVLGQVLSIRDLRQGRYVLRAVLALPNTPPQTIIRTFERR